MSTAAPPAGQEPLLPGMPLVEVNGTEVAPDSDQAQTLNAGNAVGGSPVSSGNLSPPPIKYVNIQIQPVATPVGTGVVSVPVTPAAQGAAPVIVEGSGEPAGPAREAEPPPGQPLPEGGVPRPAMAR
jgi:hypothetical protein